VLIVCDKAREPARVSSNSTYISKLGSSTGSDRVVSRPDSNSIPSTKAASRAAVHSSIERWHAQDDYRMGWNRSRRLAEHWALQGRGSRWPPDMHPPGARMVSVDNTGGARISDVSRRNSKHLADFGQRCAHRHSRLPTARRREPGPRDRGPAVAQRVTPGTGSQIAVALVVGTKLLVAAGHFSRQNRCSGSMPTRYGSGIRFRTNCVDSAPLRVCSLHRCRLVARGHSCPAHPHMPLVGSARAMVCYVHVSATRTSGPSGRLSKES
jgi:hypothetical protein